MPPLTASSRRRLAILLQLLAAAVVLWLAGGELVSYWRQYQAQPLRVEPQWSWIVASAALYLATYAVLVQTWRAVLGAWHARLSFREAARIWTVSSLGRYLGSLVQIGAMGALAHRAGVSPVAAAGAAVLGTIVNVAAGFLVILTTGWALIDLTHPSARGAGIGIVILSALALGLTPWILPRATAGFERMTGRRLDVAALPTRALLYAGIGNVVAWVMYGVAFQLLTRGVLGSALGAMPSYVAVYALSYLFGYLMFFVPAGAGFREGAIVFLMPRAGLADPLQALVLAIVSRLLLTVLEILPGLVFLAFGARPRTPLPPESQDAPR